MKKFKYSITGIDCPVCAGRVEEKIAAEEDLCNVSLNFTAETLTLEAKHDPLDRIREIAEKAEHGCKIEPMDKPKKEEEEEDEKGEIKRAIILICVSSVLFFFGVMPFVPPVIADILLVLSAVICGIPIFKEAFESVKRKRLDETFLMALAVAAAIIIGEFSEAAAVILFFSIGELLEDYAVARSKKSISALSEIRPDKANLLSENGEFVTVNAENVKVGDVIKVLPFERFPVDCEITGGVSQADCSPVTGESLPVEIFAGKKVLSGCINKTGEVTARALAESGQSAASRIIEMVESAAEKKGKAEKVITKFAVYYTPVIVALAAALAFLPPFFGAGSLSMWIGRSLVFLVASCPCALVLSVPLGFFAGIGGASKRGILVKGGNFVENVSKAKAVVFDKTGTLTSDENEIEKIRCAEGFTPDQVLEYAAYGEHFSTHPLSECVKSAYGGVDEKRISDFEEIPGNGTKALVDGERVICGSRRFLESEGISAAELGDGDAQIFVAVSGKAIGALNIESKLREDSQEAVTNLKKLGIQRIVMLTGDNRQAAKGVAEKLGIDEYYAELLPEDKLSILEKIKAESGETIFVGDGINDAPVLASAHAGAAMGLGSDAAIEAGDLILMGSRPSAVPAAIALFRKTMGIVNFNIWFALAFKAAVLVLGALGLASMWMAVFADVGVALIAIANSVRLIGGKAKIK